MMAFVGGRRYRPGQVFDLPDGTRLAPSMRVVDEARVVEPVAPAAPEPQTLSEITRRDIQARPRREAQAAKLG